MEENFLLDLDQKYLWHPFRQAKTARPLIPIVRAQGCYLYDSHNNEYLDGNSSWWVNLHGHCNSYIQQKVANQLARLDQISFGDFTHPLAIELAMRLIKHLPKNFSRVFYSDNGSTAVEIAIKMALQFWYNQDQNTHRKKIICFKGSFHGETFGAMSAAGKNPLHAPFWSHLFETVAFDPPIKGKEAQSYEQLQKIITSNECACFIFEPLILGTAGMVCYSKNALENLIDLCHKNQIITIADEVMTGFGRTGPLFASSQLAIKPQIICLAKGLTGGLLPLAATICESQIFEKFYDDQFNKALLHGHSYTANPIACAAALASLDLLEKKESINNRLEIAKRHLEFCEHIQAHPLLMRCQSLGTILALEYGVSGSSGYFHSIRNHLYEFFLEQKILMRPLGNVIYFMPPYCISNDQLTYIYQKTTLLLEKNYARKNSH